MLDDLFMIHDFLLYDLQIWFYLIYGAVISILIITHYRLILKNYFHFFISAIIFLGLSVVLDIVLVNEDIQYIIEDGLKFLGIICWMLFLLNTSFKMLIKSMSIPELIPETDR